MATVEIPIPSAANTTGNIRFRCSLEGVEYVLTLVWNSRDSSWSMGLADVDESPIVSGIVLVPTWDLLGLVTDERRPPGTLMVWSPDGAQSAPGLADLGVTQRLVYYEAA